ncbi:hypothetical protein PAHAL_2G037500 [Panicum hallii]|uniref:Uncharacterized protein n=1 Tax=Panicum hallii TaxID=206008 RepID=A0A2S3GW88_9POAL|nr:hypothetical protein PAHAL_2G037500 [Panicum hallii]
MIEDPRFELLDLDFGWSGSLFLLSIFDLGDQQLDSCSGVSIWQGGSSILVFSLQLRRAKVTAAGQV